MGLSDESTQFFNTKSELFRKVSPEYPEQLVDNMLSSMGFKPCSYSGLCIADIGSGAGQSARPLLERGFKVYCIDPSDKMNEALQEVLTNFGAANYEVKLGTGTRTTLDKETVDGIVLGNSLHWLMDVNHKIDDDALNEFRRILKPDGKIGVMFCMQRAGAPIYNIVKEVCTEVLGEKYTMHRHSLAEVLRHADYARQVIEPDAMVEHVDTYRRVADSEQDFKKWLASYTFVADAEPSQQALIFDRAVDELHKKGLFAMDGSIPMEWLTQAYVGPLKQPKL